MHVPPFVSTQRWAVDGEGGLALEIVIESCELLVLPAESRATADRTCDPFETEVVFQAMLYGLAVSSA